MPPATKICSRCGLEQSWLEFLGRRWCYSCEQALADELRAEKIRVANKTRYERRKAEGQCQRCSQPSRPGMATCAACAKRKHQAAKARRTRRKVENFLRRVTQR